MYLTILGHYALKGSIRLKKELSGLLLHKALPLACFWMRKKALHWIMQNSNFIKTIKTNSIEQYV